MSVYQKFKKRKGFTLIELVMVIVILGVLAAVALPKFVDLSDEAYKATQDGIAGALSSASVSNFAAFQVGQPYTQLTAPMVANPELRLLPLLGTGYKLPTGYSLYILRDGCTAPNAFADVRVRGPGGQGYEANATVLCTR